MKTATDLEQFFREKAVKLSSATEDQLRKELEKKLDHWLIEYNTANNTHYFLNNKYRLIEEIIDSLYGDNKTVVIIPRYA